MNDLTTYQTNQATQTTQPVPVQKTETTTQPKETWTMKERIVYGLLGLIGVGGTIWLGRKIILNARANKEQNQTFEDGNPATTAKQIKMAFENDGWPGTDTKALRQVLVSIQSQADWNKTVKSYEKLFNRNLLKDMSDELQSTEYNEMLQIIDAKPLKRGQAPTGNQYRAWAKRMKAAFDKSYGFLPGTDEAALVATLNEIPTQTAFIQVALEYKKLYGTNMIEDMKSESEFGQYDDWMKIIVEKRKK